jgi:poly-gamma-glutamate synthesis protein (capsule biosynthesis protein)
VVCAAVLAIATALAASTEQAAQQTPLQLPPNTAMVPLTRDLTKELANKTKGTFVVAAVGDVLMQEPMGKMLSPELRRILRDADTTVGNKEHYVIDSRDWQSGHGNNWAPKELAQDLADLGFDLLAPGEGDGGVAGMKSSFFWYDKVGIQIAGQGPNLTTARTPVFQQTPKGRVALASAFPVPDRGAGANAIIAADRNGNSGTDRFGLNPLRLTVWNVVSPEMLRQFKAMKDAVMARRTESDVARPMNVGQDAADRVTLFADQRYMAGEKVGAYHYEMNAGDLEANILAVRNAKEYGDYVMFTMHSHQNRYAYQAYSQDHYPADFLVELTHKLVDNGMDMYVGHGNHTIAGIEIYKGRPIFYNLGNFSVMRFGAEYSVPSGDGMTAIERGDQDGRGTFQQYINLVAILAQTTYQDGILKEVRIYPVDLGVDRSKRPWSKMSIPTTPSPELANRILADVQKYSEPFGTKISIENGVGVIRVPASATVPIGGDIRSTFQPGAGRAGGRGRSQGPAPGGGR